MKSGCVSILLSASLSVLGTVACSAGSGSVLGLPSSSRSGVGTGQPISGISDSDRAAICDWVAESNGGYGASRPKIQCDGFEVTPKAPKTRADCVESLAKSAATCTATVGQVEDCVVYFQDNPCSKDKNPPACAPLMNTSCMGRSTTTVTVVDGSGSSSSSSSDDAPPERK